ncbi:MAG: ABC transporter ATP-binding protein [Clostridiales bacterium]|nr:ABC transporter ATP-binding protein [Clostridiales bacterium]
MKLCISKSYEKQVVFENLELDIKQGEILCVLGESGGGKTTLLNMLAGLTAFEGTIDGAPTKVGYIFQEPRLLPNLTVEENLRYVGGTPEKIDELLQKTELTACRNKKPRALSGGEKQRVAIARAFLSDSEVLLLDEPFSSLDTALKIRLAGVFATLWKTEKKTAVFVTHDIEEACMLAHRVVVLKSGKIALDLDMGGGDLPRKYGENSFIKEKILATLVGE